MVPVVVDHRHAARLAGLREPALHAAELAQRLYDRVLVQTHLLGDRDRGERVLDIVLAEHR